MLDMLHFVRVMTHSNEQSYQRGSIVNVHVVTHLISMPACMQKKKIHDTYNRIQRA